MTEAGSNLSNEISEADKPNNFIPDLCQTQSILFTLLLTQIFAFFVSIISSQKTLIEWEFLGFLSIYCQGVALSCVAITCRLKSLSQSWHARKTAAIVLSANSLIGLSYGLIFSRLIPIYSSEPDSYLLVYKSALITSILSALVLRYFYLQHQWRLQKQSELRARLQALQSRIRPHFLFNSMNSIAGLIGIDPNKAEDAILDLSELFRATLSEQSLLTPLEQELELCQRYLNIETLRLGPRLEMEWKIDAELLKTPIPALSIQPLFENAVYHGIQPRVDGGKITFHAYRQNHFAYILISNPIPETAEQTLHKGNQIALSNIKSRIQTLYGEQAVIKTSVADRQFIVTLRLPLEHSHD